ncbi:helix-turn-helix transcriptional regulator [Haloarcula nitratireducens]|uniref:MarR family transcriptional regulator n=1 Tax=Haloarcula nitratireducens TaxID=2487749 RepID=A0AAW4PLC1_9EURY|nr:MarR family transcriptional regulator [Halomicroarcula nitratireducens]MBX0298181.1 MarR family transcriptional regulator [Halomicroarcula nitratireducens]
MVEDTPPGSALNIEVIKRSPMLAALHEGAMDRHSLEQRLGISKSTVHRNTNSLAEQGLIERSDGEYQLTKFGEAVAEVVATFEADMRTTVRLAPLFEAISAVQPGCSVEAFSDATVTTATDGDPFAPLARFVSLVQETETLRMFDSYAVAPTYMDEIHGQVLDGLETKVIERPDIALDIMENYPRKCVELCASEFLTMRVHDTLPFGIGIFDSKIGVGIRDRESGSPRAFIDTETREAREWAETLFESYWNEATQLDRFHPKALREAIDSDA